MSYSIVTVAFNAAPDLALTFESILQQDFSDYELIFVDGGSWDGTAQIVERYAKDIDKIVHVEDAGVYHAMMASLEYCSKEYVLFMNAGDRFFSENVLDKIWEARDGSPDIVFGDHVYVSEKTETLVRARDFSLTMRALQKGDISHRWHSGFPAHQATFARVSLLNRLRYDTRFEICADHDFLLRAFDKGASFQHVDEVICHYVGGGYSARRLDRCKLEWAYAYRRYSSNPAAVDRLFCGDHSPFSPETIRTGMLITGHFPVEGPYPEHGVNAPIRWCAARGFQMLSPAVDLALSCTIKGYNTLPDQALMASLDGRRIGRCSIPVGEFAVVVTFSELVPPLSFIEFQATNYSDLSESDARFVSIAIASIAFTTLETDRPARKAKSGDIFFFTAAQEHESRELLLAGWADQENSHVWSTGPQSFIRIFGGSDIKALKLTVSANPFVSEMNRTMELSLNGQSQGRHQLLVTPSTVTLDCDTAAWKTDIPNLVGVRPATMSAAPADERLLGVCLYILEAV
jgi:GT2 family glycosyltransferase